MERPVGTKPLKATGDKELVETRTPPALDRIPDHSV